VGGGGIVLALHLQRGGSGRAVAAQVKFETKI
jgi:hypothetical protein